MVPRDLVLQIISSSVDCFFNKNYFENSHCVRIAGLCRHLLELRLRVRGRGYPGKDRARSPSLARPAFQFSFGAKPQQCPPGPRAPVVPPPLNLCLLLHVYPVHYLKSMCKPVVFSLIKLHLSLCGQIVFLESTFLENIGNSLLRFFFFPFL